MKFTLTALVLLLMIMGCANVPPRVTYAPNEPINIEKPFFLVVNRDRAEVEKALKKEGVKISEQSLSSIYELRVRVGRSVAHQDCGSVHNVSYEVLDRGMRVMIIKGRGPAGSCKPNIFDQMSKELVAQSAN